MGRVLKQVSKISGNYGQAGEERVSQYLSQELPEEYIILNSPRLYHAGETVDIDHIVLGPRGIFAVESKNMQGVVSGGLMGNWIQTKTRNGQTEQVKIGNPANQVNHYAKVVREFLSHEYEKKYGTKINLRVLPVVVFAHDNADLSRIKYTNDGMVGRVRILSLEGMKEYVLTKRKLTYNPTVIEKLAEIIIPQDQRDQTGIFHSMVLPNYKDTFSERYDVGKEIGRGNFGVVYRGYDKKIDREVAIKKLHPSQQHDQEAVDRFLREATISAKLHHDNIVTVYDFYEENNEHYLVMEFLESQTLDYYLRENNPDLTEVASIMNEICAGLAHAHENCVVHRDLKPANILVTADKKIKISDFGIARLSGAPMLTQTHTSLGTPFAMSPEQILGKEIDPRSDIFALGVLLYYMVTKELPFKGENIGEVVYKVLHANPEPPSKLNHNITPALEKVILKALEKDPLLRFQTVGEMRSALKSSLDPNNVAHILLSKDPFGRKVGKLVWYAIKETITNQEKRFKFVGAVTALFFFWVFASQAYRDSFAVMPSQRPTTIINEKTKSANFTNDNIATLYKSPAKFKASSVDFTGRVDGVLNQVKNQYLFSVAVETPGTLENNHIAVVYKDGPPNLRLQGNFVHLKGFVKTQLSNPVTMSVEPLIEAKSVEIVPAWVVLSPTIKAVPVNKSVTHNGRKITLKKVEFAEHETRLFLDIVNETDQQLAYSLNDTVGIQARRIIKLNYYRNDSDLQFVLGPREKLSAILVLDSMAINYGSASFSIGAKLFGDSPYIMEVKW